MGSITPTQIPFRDEEIEQHIGSTKLQLSRNLTTFPKSILKLALTLTHLDLSNNSLLSTLPESISSLTNLKILFLSNCSFASFPNLSRCPSLEMVAFKSNRMVTVPDGHLPPKLRWLILTNNAITSLPSDIGTCANLTKCMLAGNQLSTLPEGMQNCKNLTLLRLSRNNLAELPPWLLSMPSLAFLSFAGNPFCTALDTTRTPLPHIPWPDLQIGALLGEGASGMISRAEWHNKSVAVKIFKGALTSDGSPIDELAATIAADSHTNLVSPLGLSSPDQGAHPGLVMELIPPQYDNLGLPPNFVTCARDTFPENADRSVRVVVRILSGIAAAAEHLHKRNVLHGDLYAHNILTSANGHPLLGDFGAASIYDGFSEEIEMRLQQLEVLAFGFLIEDLLSLISAASAMVGEKEWKAVQELRDLCEACVVKNVGKRPMFEEVVEILKLI